MERADSGDALQREELGPAENDHGHCHHDQEQGSEQTAEHRHPD